MNRWTDKLLRHIEDSQIDPSFAIPHRMQLGDAPQGRQLIEAVLKP